MIPLVVILGPTASGKTSLAIEIAAAVGGEVVSADSMQVYKKMNIGTAKPTDEEMHGIPHHLIDFVSPAEDFSLGKYAQLAHEKIKNIYGRGKLPMLVGGTGLYIDTVINNLRLANAPADEKLRERLTKEAEEGTLYKKLCEVDPKTAAKLHLNDIKRIVRAMEQFILTGETKTEGDKKSLNTKKIYDSLIFGLEKEREVLYNSIDMRVDAMVQAGLFSEVEEVVKGLNGKKCTAMQGVGYKEIVWYLEGVLTYDEAVNLVKRNTRRLAKRQMTWFRRNEDILWIKPTDSRLCIEKIKERWSTV